MKRILALCCALVLALGMLGCATAEEAAAPKYVFMFIGTGMGSPQVSATQYFVGTLRACCRKQLLRHAHFANKSREERRHSIKKQPAKAKKGIRS